jgi:hypothetical protein
MLHVGRKVGQGANKSLESAPSASAVKGTKDRQAEQNRSTPVDPEKAWPGNVTGMYSDKVKLP